MAFIILLILIIRIVKYANRNGLNPYKWGALLFLNWLVFDLCGVSLLTFMLDIKVDYDFIVANMFYAFLIEVFGIGCGFLGYFVTRRNMDRSIVKH